MKKVFIAGGITYDLIINLDTLPQGKAGTLFSSKSKKCVGGTGAGKALNLSRLGFDTMLHAFVGNDENGKKVKEYMSATKINFIAETDERGTESFTNLIDKNGQRISIFTEYNTFNPKFDTTIIEKMIAEADFIVINIMNYCRNLIPIAKKYNKEIWCDIHDYDGKSSYYDDFINGANYIFMSSELGVDYKDLMDKFIKQGKKMVVCTHGKDGADILTNDGKTYSQPIIAGYEKKDVNGAGDSFFSGFLYGFAKGESIEKSMKYAAINGGLSVTSEELYYTDLTPEKLEEEYMKYFETKTC